MPSFRCSYCGHVLGEEPPKGPCPSCGKHILVRGHRRRLPLLRWRQDAGADEQKPGAEAARRPLVDAGAPAPVRLSLFVIPAVVLVLIIAAFLLNRYCVVTKPVPDQTRSHRYMTAKRELAALYGALEGYKFDCGAYPNETNGLKCLVLKFDNLKWNGPYVNLLQKDPWRRPYFYRLDGTGFVLKSLGPDGIESSDDVLIGANWTNYVEYAPMSEEAAP